MKYLTDEQIEDARDAALLADRCKVIDVPPGCDIRFMIPRYGLPKRIRPRRPAWEPWPCWGRVKSDGRVRNG